MKRLLVLALPALISQSTHALDSNGNGMSDVWEMLHNQVALFPANTPDLAATADPDGDGQSNLLESFAGTNPFSGIPPEGLFQVQIAPAYWPLGSFRLTLPSSRPGKNYVFSTSPDLSAGSWTPFDPIPGDGANLTITVDPAIAGTENMPERAFFRATAGDQPNPGGLFSPWELAVLSNNAGIAAAIQPIVQPPGTGGPVTPEPPPPVPNSDNSGPNDQFDAAPHDDKVDWFRTPEAKYILIPITGTAGFEAVDVSDSGKVLFTRTTPVANYATDPVGLVWDPAKAAGDRITPVLFAPSNFTLNFLKTTWNDEIPTTEITASTAPLPAPVDPENPAAPQNPSVSLGVRMKAIGEDGSLIADIDYSMSEHEGHVEKHIRSGGALLAFLWQGTQYGTCRMLGTDRGYRGAVDSGLKTEDYAVGFYRDTTVDNPVTKAVFTNQVIDQHTFAPSNLGVETCSTTDLAGGFMNGHISHKPGLPPEPVISRFGRILIQNRVSASEINQIVCGTANTAPLPSNLFPESFTDLPTGNWGLGSSNGPFKVRTGGAFESIASLNGVLAFDHQGNGIGNGQQGRGIWRNARWLTLEQATGASSLNGMAPKKISPSGLILIGNETATANSLLIPVEIAAPALNHGEGEIGDILFGADELKVAKMERSLGTRGLNIDLDPHRFHVRIPSRLGGAPVVAKIGTVDNAVSTYDDPATEVHLTANAFQQQSQSQLLVSDEVDDAADITDEDPGDRTHRVSLGANVEIATVKIGASTYGLNMKVPVKTKRYLDVTIIMVGNASSYAGEMIKFKKVAKERYAQIGVNVNFVDKTMAAPPPPFQEEDVRHEPGIILTPGDNGRSPNPDVAALVDRANAENLRGAITVFVVRNMLGNDRGRAHIKKFLAPSQQGYGNIAILSANDMVDVPDPGANLPEKRMWFTLAHEVMHLLTEAGGHYGHGNANADPNAHPGQDDYGSGIAHLIQHNLLRDGSSDLNELNESKRIYRMQQLLCAPELFNNP